MSKCNRFKVKSVKSAKEGIPEGIVSRYNSDYTRGTYKNGSYTVIPDKKEISRQLKKIGDYFAEAGYSLDKINWDDYLIEGVSLEKLPKNCLTLIFYKGVFVFCDTTTRNKGRFYKKMYEIGNFYVYRNGKDVRLTKVPKEELLKNASAVYVVPEEDLVEVTELRKNRYNSKNGVINRNHEVGKASDKRDREDWLGRTIYDKSGYRLRDNELRDRLREYKGSKLLKDGGLEKARNLLSSIKEEFESLLKRGMAVLDRCIYSEKPTKIVEFDWLDQVYGVKVDILSFEKKLDKFSTDEKPTPQALEYFISELSNFWGDGEVDEDRKYTYSYDGKRFKEKIKKFIELKDIKYESV